MCEYCEPKPLKWAYRFYFGVKANGRPRHALKNVSINFCPMCGRKLNEQPPAMAKENKDESDKKVCNN